MSQFRFVALGDSFTEGVGDPGPDGTLHGWADRFAQILAVRHDQLHYANLAIRGLTTRRILDTQLRPAVTLKPDLVSAVIGMNDLIRPKMDFRQFAADLDTLLSGLAATGAVVLTATLPTPAQGTPLPTPLRRSLVKRMKLANAFIRRTATVHGALCLDLAEIMPPGIGGWSDDRLHPGPDGHQAVANAYMDLLDGAAPRRLDVAEIVTGDVVEPSLAEQLRWARQFLVPWVQRRLRGQSSSSGVVAKLPAYRAVQSQP
jgi:lysophospholipase L1-like esterase